MPSLYTFTDYSPAWPYEFEQEAARLRTLLGEEFFAIHHIGSTSVPGLAAKPIIDLLPLVRNIERVDDYNASFEEAGYSVKGENGLPGRRYFTKDRGQVRTHNIHIFQEDDPDVERHLAFCAYLRDHEPIRDEYAILKRKVYARHPADVMAYNDGKDAWIKRIERQAVAWYRQQMASGHRSHKQ